MKKLLLTAVTLSILVLPLGGTALADHEQAPDGGALTYLDHRPGDVPAQTDAVEAMTPAIHGAALAMLNHDAQSLDLSDGELAWETVYNMLSLYGQLDTRSVIEDGILFLPDETAQDYASALDLDPDSLVPTPDALQDRISYDNVSHCYAAVCGEDDLARVLVEEAVSSGAGLQLTGALVYEADGQILARFQAGLQPRDNMFGFALTALTLTT